MTVEIANESGEPADEARLAACATHVLAVTGVDPGAELSVLLVDTDHMARLHVEHSGEQGATDVLAFEQDDLGAVTSPHDPEAVPALLGDVVICPPVARAQARQAGHAPQEELELLLVHGVLHLLGWDHDEAEREREMFALQAQLLRDWRTTGEVADVPGPVGDRR